MDKLKDLLQKRKGQQAQQSWVKKEDQVKQQREEYLKKLQEREQEQIEKKLQKFKENSELYKGNIENIEELYQEGIKRVKIQQDLEERQRKNQQSDSEDENNTQKVPMEKEQVIIKLREMNQPVTLFGESDRKRYQRYIRCKENLKELQENKIGGGEYRGFKKQNEYEPKLKDVEIDQQFLDNLLKKKIDMNARDKKKNDDYVVTISKDEKLFTVENWINKILKEWEEKLNQDYPDAEAKKTKQWKEALGVFKQCFEYIDPMVKLIKLKKLSEDILNPCYQIAFYCLQKEYVRANDKYLDVSIGNAPWPMGVTMVGIHERAGRSKIFSSQIAHVLNDENQRKYLQSIKRLITVSQKLYPSDPSKMVNFGGIQDKIF